MTFHLTLEERKTDGTLGTAPGWARRAQRDPDGRVGNSRRL